MNGRNPRDKMLAWTMEVFHNTPVSAEAPIATMGILRFEREKGRRPQNLDDVAASVYIHRVPIDPYSGGPLVYRHMEDSFTLYSFGRDFDDDGETPSLRNRPPDGGDQIFRPVEERRK